MAAMIPWPPNHAFDKTPLICSPLGEKAWDLNVIKNAATDNTPAGSASYPSFFT